MSVRVLVLYIRERTDDTPGYRLPYLPWKEWLYKITRLHELHMDIVSEDTSEEIIAFVRQLRSKMVVGGEQVGTESFTLGRRSIPSVSWTARDPPNSLATGSTLPDMEENHCW
ncbi:hypothetical protein HO173_001406 [Letharia columbiana]|uniref:Uncharacterized protein n=1 Tax=Letharia columbiana TaxID=112416 RepID=A0A8H6G556_9LECA|nr:uncharacterized protein HO173_001406 [Letharia columbiana]KAF6240733.1 hypothetical protein HO173_001406 [Letharia columbiana]